MSTSSRSPCGVGLCGCMAMHPGSAVLPAGPSARSRCVSGASGSSDGCMGLCAWRRQPRGGGEVPALQEVVGRGRGWGALAQKRVAAVCVAEQLRSSIDRQAVMMHHAGGQIRERVISAPRWPRLALWGTVFTELRDVDGGRVSAYRWCAVRRRGMVDHDVNASNRMICLRRAYNVNATLANP